MSDERIIILYKEEFKAKAWREFVLNDLDLAEGKLKDAEAVTFTMTNLVICNGKGIKIND